MTDKQLACFLKQLVNQLEKIKYNMMEELPEDLKVREKYMGIPCVSSPVFHEFDKFVDNMEKDIILLAKYTDK